MVFLHFAYKPDPEKDTLAVNASGRVTLPRDLFENFDRYQSLFDAATLSKTNDAEIFNALADIDDSAQAAPQNKKNNSFSL